jgi:UDP-3-O-[3-hydroxymyristoyl] N-acetylglucosamine deacetylase
MSQRTIAHSVTATGVGLHSGQTVTMTLHPAPANHGIAFQRLDLPNQPIIKATWDIVSETPLCTLLVDAASGATIGTIEHLMAALYGQKIDNLLVTLDAAEVPIMDGSAAPFMFLLDCAGETVQDAPRLAIEILRDVVVQDGDKSVTLSPASVPTYSFAADYGAAIGKQERSIQMVNGNLRGQILNARTFCKAQDVEMMRQAGLIRGGSLHNAIVFDEEKILNATGLRYTDEAVRHKILDAVGDLYLAGYPILGAYHGHKAGHAMNNRILRALFAQPDSYRLVTFDAV